MPRLVLECAPFGSLEDQHDEDPNSVEEAFEVLCQGLSALRGSNSRHFLPRLPVIRAECQWSDNACFDGALVAACSVQHACSATASL